jgi:FkbM family methyltransferase
MIDYPTFRHFNFLEPHTDGSFQIDCLGAKARSYYMPASWFNIGAQPTKNELLFEWIDILDAVASAGDRVTVVDLGAGYGRWLVIAALAAKQLGRTSHVVGVEAESVHYKWMLQHLADNGIPPSDYTAIQDPVSDRGKEVSFVQGHPDEWYGQSILEKTDSAFGEWPNAKITKLHAISALSVIRRYPLIDALHMDIQGEELRVVPSIMKFATLHVRRIHVETHTPEIDEALPAFFWEHGWTPRFQFPCDRKAVATPFGSIDFQGGVQSWENPRSTRSLPTSIFARSPVNLPNTRPQIG